MEIDFDELGYEKKFVVSELKPYEVEHFIKLHPAMFSEILYHGRKSNTRQNSIYLDSIELENYKEHISGVSERLKIRIRWYEKIFGLIKKPKLEIKIKRNELRDKLLFPLKPFTLDKNFSSAYLQKEVFAKSNLPKWLAEQLKFYEPVLLTSYRRKYFLSENKKYRLTFDTELKFFKIKCRDNFFLEKIEDDYNSILELKYLVKDYQDAHWVTEHFPFRLIAYSKYVSGISLLDM